MLAPSGEVVAPDLERFFQSVLWRWWNGHLRGRRSKFPVPGVHFFHEASLGARLFSVFLDRGERYGTVPTVRVGKNLSRFGVRYFHAFVLIRRDRMHARK